MRGFSFVLLTAIVCLLLQTAGCDNIPDQPPRFVVVLMDETESFRIDTLRFWPEVRSLVAGKIVRRLEPGEGFGLIGIDDHGFDTDDIRIEMVVLDHNPLVSTKQKRELVRKVEGLGRRRVAKPYTDILGALQQAANLVKREKDHSATIMVFSDMIQTRRYPGREAASELTFPRGTRIYCFYVNATSGDDEVTGKESWDAIVNGWTTIFDRAGLKYTTDDGELQFYERGDSKRALERLFLR